MKAAVTNITCEHYLPKLDDRHCTHYAGSGRCARTQGSVCVEWRKANEPWSADDQGPVSYDLFGDPLPPPQQRKPKMTRDPRTGVQIQAASASAVLPYHEVPVVRNLTDDHVTSFKALHTDVCLQTEELGPVWLVPEYTGQDRKELSIEHLATLSALCSVFPGAKVVALNQRKSIDENPAHAKETPVA